MTLSVGKLAFGGIDYNMDDLTEYELKELREKAQAWDIAWPALIFLDATGELDRGVIGGRSVSQTLKDAVKCYNGNRNKE